MTLISIIPPVDAFYISKVNQTQRLKNALQRNQMLDHNTIIANASISNYDKEIIIQSVRYLRQMNEIEEISWLQNYNNNGNMETVFGFSEYDSIDKTNDYVSFYLNREKLIPVNGYDYILDTEVSDRVAKQSFGEFHINGTNFSLLEKRTDEIRYFVLMEEDRAVIRLSLDHIFEEFEQVETGIDSNQLTLEDATFSNENEEAIISIVVKNLSINTWEDQKDYFIDCYVLLKIK